MFEARKRYDLCVLNYVVTSYHLHLLLKDTIARGLQLMIKDRGAQVFFPAPEYCTDNGAMIAYAGALGLLAGERDEQVFDVLPRWSIEGLGELPV